MADTAKSIWGVEVLVTTQIADGTAALIDTTKIGRVYVRQPLQLLMGWANDDFTKKTGDWKLTLGGSIHTVNGPKDQTGAIFIREKGASDGKSPKVLADIDGIDYDCEPLNPSEKAENTQPISRSLSPRSCDTASLAAEIHTRST